MKNDKDGRLPTKSEFGIRGFARGSWRGAIYPIALLLNVFALSLLDRAALNRLEVGAILTAIVAPICLTSICWIFAPRSSSKLEGDLLVGARILAILPALIAVAMAYRAISEGL